MKKDKDYGAIERRILQNIQFTARQLARIKAVPGMDLEDYEQDLLADLIHRTRAFNPNRSSYRTFADRVVRHRASSLKAETLTRLAERRSASPAALHLGRQVMHINSSQQETVRILLQEGLRCFPCSKDKRPATPHGYKDAVSDFEAWIRLWHRHSGPLIGVATGEMSAFDVLDIDARHGGGRWFAENRDRLPPTRVHRTRSGGLHLFFRHRAGTRCSSGKVAPGVDVRADGGYVIWWPAVGCPVLASKPIAVWPEWLWQSPSEAEVRPVRVVIPDDAGLSRLVRTVAAAHPGERNSITYWAACRVGEMVASGLLPADSATEVIAEAALRAGLPLSEARRTVRSGIRTTGRA